MKAALFLLLALVASAARAANSVVLKGHVPRELRTAVRLERLPAGENVALALVVEVDQALLDRTLDGLYGPGAPKNKRFLTSDEFARTFDLEAKRRALKDFARGAGLSVDGVDKPSGLVVKVSGPAGAVERAFGVQLHRYRGADGRVFRANDSDPSVPASLAPHLHAVFGLSNVYGKARPHFRRASPTTRARAAAAGAPGAAPRFGITNGSGPSGGLAPADIKSIYGLTPGLNGSGQTVALLELDGYIATDPAKYATQFGLTLPTVTCLSSDSTCGECGPNQTDPCNATTFTGGQSDESGTGDSGMIEVALDIDMVVALSTGISELRVYTALNADADLLTAYGDIAADNVAKVVSTSWGEDEADVYFGDSTVMTSENTIFKQMATQGQSMFASSGDEGAFDASSIPGSVDSPSTLVTDDPASQPYVTGVGGTSLSGTIASHTETTWNGIPGNACSAGAISNCTTYGAGGGGIADYNDLYWPLPSYQTSLSGVASTLYRNVPDVSLNADPNASPYSICVNGTCNDTTNGTTLIGGTSAATPLWASLTALVNQQRAKNGYGTLGFANPPLYQLGAAGGSLYSSNFNDINDGSNNGNYTTGAGYDNATGWGSFKANALISALSTPQSGTPASPSATTLGVSSISWTWTAAPDTAYNVYYATNVAQSLALATAPPYVQTGLLADATAGIKVFATVDGIQASAGVVIASATFAAAPAAAPAAVGFASSATFTFSACPAPPAANSCSGYDVQVSSDAGFTGTVFSSASLNGTAIALTVTGLSLTSYYARLAYLNPNGFPSPGPSLQFFMNAVQPSLPTFSSVSTGAVTFGWNANGNPPGEVYVAQASTASDYSGAVFLASGTATFESFGGLAADTSYYFRVQGVGGPFLNAGPQATLAAVPAFVAPAFVALGSATLTAQWGAAGNAPDAAYEADLALNASFSPLFSSAGVVGTSAVFGGLAPNATYYARARALGRTGTPSAYLALGSTITLTSPPSFPAAPFAALSTGSFTVAFNTGGNPAGTRYVVQASTNAAFATLTAQATTTGSGVSFAGLWSNATYYVQVAALNSGGSSTAFSAPASTATLVAGPGAGAAAFGATISALTPDWSVAGFAPGTSFSASVSAAPAPFIPVATTVATSSFAVVSGLSANTTYYAQVQALSQSSDPNGPAVSLGAASTLTNPVTAASFVSVFVSSAIVSWTPLPAAPQSAAAEGYRVDLSTSPSFATLSVSVSTPATASSALVGGLGFSTTYYARVGALNWQGGPDYFSVAGGTQTGTAVLSTGVVSGAPLVLSIGGLPPPLISVTVTIPGGAFPAGTDASAIDGFFGTPLTTLAGAASNEAPITPLGASAAFCVSAAASCLYSGGPQPSAPVLFSIAYNPAQLPPGYPESSIQLMRFDPASGQWTLVASQDDPNAHVLTAYTQHFSLFAPFFLTPASAGDVADVQIFPQPWELGAPGSAYFASVLTFASLPAGADVKIFTLAGERVWEGSASGSGVATWDGTNRFGRSAASGTYLVVIQSGGTKRLRRVVLIR